MNKAFVLAEKSDNSTYAKLYDGFRKSKTAYLMDINEESMKIF
jgi:hypothetical protein